MLLNGLDAMTHGYVKLANVLAKKPRALYQRGHRFSEGGALWA